MEKVLGKSSTSWKNIFLSLFGIFFLRVALESFSSPINRNGDFPSWEGLFLHIPLSYLAIYLTLLLVLFFIAKIEIKRIALFLTFAHLLILLPPILDLLLNGAMPNSVGYQILNMKEIPKFFLKIFLFEKVSGVTFGMRIAATLLAIGSGLFVFEYTKSRIKAVLSFLSVFGVMFLYAVLPSFFVVFQSAHSNSLIAPIVIFNGFIEKSWLVSTSKLSTDVGYDLAMAQTFFLLVFLQLLAIFFFYKKDVCKATLSNMRWERIFNYALIAVIGMIVAQKSGSKIDLFNVVNVVTLSVFFLLLIINAALAIFVNDSQDIEIDRISNTQRPLISSTVDLKMWTKISIIIAILFVYGLLILNVRVLFFMILVQFSFFIYSVKPLRLKNNFVSASLLIGVTAASMSLAGFFLVSNDSNIWHFPIKILGAIFFSQALLSNMKDIKDYEGDTKENIKTLPVVFGIANAKKIIAFLYAIVFIAIPLLFSLKYMLYFALLASVFVWYLFTRRIFREKYAFMLIFLYMLLLAITQMAKI